jgi:hypothetical protein
MTEGTISGRQVTFEGGGSARSTGQQLAEGSSFFPQSTLEKSRCLDVTMEAFHETICIPTIRTRSRLHMPTKG